MMVVFQTIGDFLNEKRVFRKVVDEYHWEIKVNDYQF